MAENRILIVDFGGQYNQLIARRVRECGVYSEVRGYESIDLGGIREFDPKGIIFTGGPQSGGCRSAGGITALSLFTAAAAATAGRKRRRRAAATRSAVAERSATRLRTARRFQRRRSTKPSLS